MVSFACISQKKTNNIDQVHLCSSLHWFVACAVKSCQAVLKVKCYHQGAHANRRAVSHQRVFYLPCKAVTNFSQAPSMTSSKGLSVRWFFNERWMGFSLPPPELVPPTPQKTGKGKGMGCMERYIMGIREIFMQLKCCQGTILKELEEVPSPAHILCTPQGERCSLLEPIHTLNICTTTPLHPTLVELTYGHTLNISAHASEAGDCWQTAASERQFFNVWQGCPQADLSDIKGKQLCKVMKGHSFQSYLWAIVRSTLVTKLSQVVFSERECVTLQ